MILKQYNAQKPNAFMRLRRSIIAYGETYLMLFAFQDIKFYINIINTETMLGIDLDTWCLTSVKSISLISRGIA